jgi:hypothetical protein
MEDIDESMQLRTCFLITHQGRKREESEKDECELDKEAPRHHRSFVVVTAE